jgi:hypothetical protein
MRQGIDRAGQHLYPVLPYPHFTRATDEDIAGMYAFLMTRAPVRAEAPPNTVPFSLSVRATIAGWSLLFLRPGVWRADPSQTAEWNRGSYLVDAVGHCGACHTPHNALEAETSRSPEARQKVGMRRRCKPHRQLLLPGQSRPSLPICAQAFRRSMAQRPDRWRR